MLDSYGLLGLVLLVQPPARDGDAGNRDRDDEPQPPKRSDPYGRDTSVCSFEDGSTEQCLDEE